MSAVSDPIPAPSDDINSIGAISTGASSGVGAIRSSIGSTAATNTSSSSSGGDGSTSTSTSSGSESGIVNNNNSSSSPPRPNSVRQMILEKTSSIADLSTSVGEGKRTCNVCDKAVYPIEKVLCGGLVWHAACFTCGVGAPSSTTIVGCGTRLNPSPNSYVYVKDLGSPFCNACYNKSFLHGRPKSGVVTSSPSPSGVRRGSPPFVSDVQEKIKLVENRRLGSPSASAAGGAPPFGDVGGVNGNAAAVATTAIEPPPPPTTTTTPSCLAADPASAPSSSASSSALVPAAPLLAKDDDAVLRDLNQAARTILDLVRSPAADSTAVSAPTRDRVMREMQRVLNELIGPSPAGDGADEAAAREDREGLLQDIMTFLEHLRADPNAPTMVGTVVERIVDAALMLRAKAGESDGAEGAVVIYDEQGNVIAGGDPRRTLLLDDMGEMDEETLLDHLHSHLSVSGRAAGAGITAGGTTREANGSVAGGGGDGSLALTSARPMSEEQSQALSAFVQNNLQAIAARPWLLLLLLTFMPLKTLLLHASVLIVPLRLLQQLLLKRASQRDGGRAGGDGSSDGEEMVRSDRVTELDASRRASEIDLLGGGPGAGAKAAGEGGDGELDRASALPVYSQPQLRVREAMSSSSSNVPISGRPGVPAGAPPKNAAGSPVNRKYCEKPFDGNGVLSYIGMRGGTQPFRNPADDGLVVVTVDEESASNACGSTAVGTSSGGGGGIGGGGTMANRLVEQDKPVIPNMVREWFVVDLGANRRLIPTKFCLLHGHASKGNAARNWEVQAKIGPQDKWTLLRRFVNDRKLSGAVKSTAVWDLTDTQAGAGCCGGGSAGGGRMDWGQGASLGFRFFKLVKKGPNSAPDDPGFFVAAVEFYGTLIEQPVAR